MPLFDLFWAMLWFFLYVAWLSVLITVLGDVFRRDDMSGGLKALWVLLLIILPFAGVFGYLITAGDGFVKRRSEAARAQARARQEYIRRAAGGGEASAAAELEKLSELKASGVLTDAEFAAQKAKLLG